MKPMAARADVDVAASAQEGDCQIAGLHQKLSVSVFAPSKDRPRRWNGRGRANPEERQPDYPPAPLWNSAREQQPDSRG